MWFFASFRKSNFSKAGGFDFFVKILFFRAAHFAKKLALNGSALLAATNIKYIKKSNIDFLE